MPEKINKMPEFYTILPEKIVFARIFLGGPTALPLPPVSYAYVHVCTFTARCTCAHNSIAIVSRLSVPLSVCSSVTLKYCGHSGWVTTSKVITWIISLGIGSSLFGPQHWLSVVKGDHSKILVGIGVGYEKWLFQAENPQSLKANKL